MKKKHVAGILVGLIAFAAAAVTAVAATTVLIVTNKPTQLAKATMKTDQTTMISLAKATRAEVDKELEGISSRGATW